MICNEKQNSCLFSIVFTLHKALAEKVLGRGSLASEKFKRQTLRLTNHEVKQRKFEWREVQKNNWLTAED